MSATNTDYDLSQREADATKSDLSVQPTMISIDERYSEVDVQSNSIFLTSMTFASNSPMLGICDCGACGIITKEDVPLPIAKALEVHKSKRPLQRNQDRRLLKRQEDVSLWEWTLPLQAEPMLEFGSSHRFIYVKRLPGILQSIGPVGIVGSQQEEESRQPLDWAEGDVVLVPSNGSGQALGYVHANSVSKRSTDEQATYAALFICKIPATGSATLSCASYADKKSLLPSWHERLRSLSFDLLRDVPAGTSVLKLNTRQAQVVIECFDIH
ncbi:hypothetical protein MPSEU_000519000 [Mayamaea pseudoterrestris]|nr:hypothetical protein MPSEU_000519000 [Mayamaea pseudoterrestris]